MNWTFSYNPKARGRNRIAVPQTDVPFEAKMALFESLSAFVVNPTMANAGDLKEYHARDAMKAR